MNEKVIAHAKHDKEMSGQHLTTSRIESRTIKARLEIGVDSYEGKLSCEDLMAKLKDIVAITCDMHRKTWE